MAREDDYRARIAEYDWAALLDLWETIKAGETPDWDKGKAFEYLVLRAFQLEGAEVRWPFVVTLWEEQIEQIDGVVYAEGLACLVESKDTEEAVNVEPIAKMRNQLLRRPSAAIGMLFSRSGFTLPAQTLARFIAPQTVLLWVGDEVDHALRHRCFRAALRRKHQIAIETGFTDHDIVTEVP